MKERWVVVWLRFPSPSLVDTVRLSLSISKNGNATKVAGKFLTLRKLNALSRREKADKEDADESRQGLPSPSMPVPAFLRGVKKLTWAVGIVAVLLFVVGICLFSFSWLIEAEIESYVDSSLYKQIIVDAYVSSSFLLTREASR